MRLQGEAVIVQWGQIMEEKSVHNFGTKLHCKKKPFEIPEGRQERLDFANFKKAINNFATQDISLTLLNLRNLIMLLANSLKVAVRVRPFNQREKAMRSKCIISMVGNNCAIVDPKDLSNKKTFTFDYCYWSADGYIENDQGVYLPDGPHSRYMNQEQVFNDLGRAVLENAWKGYNTSLFSYGQTGTGKSYSMTGHGGNKGLVPMICEELFQEIKQHQNKGRQFCVYFGMFEIYNEQVSDLLSKYRKLNGLRVREGRHGFYVEHLKSVPCSSFKQLEVLLDQGIRNRSVALTNWNTTSSRSHMVISIHFQQVVTDQFTMKHSEINLVDLAGSERQQSAGVASDRFNEARAINLSLTTLGNVISSLSDKAVGKRVQYIPYRNSVLTRLLSTALGGNSKTIMVTTISPADIFYDGTMSTLRFAERAKNIQNRAVINESLTEQLLIDLKEDNTRLQARIANPEKAGDIHVDEQEVLKRLIVDNEQQLKEMQKSWQQRLEEAKKEWEQQYSSITKDEKMVSEFPYFLNVNEDPQLSGVVRHFIHHGISAIGRNVCLEQDIVLKGLGILDKHALLTVCDDKVVLEPVNKAKVTVNGVPVLTKHQLHHLDRVIMGSCSFYLYVGFPHERSGRDKIHKYSYEFFASELASIEAFGQVNLGVGEKQAENLDPNLARIFHDFTAIMPMVAQANQISEELNKGVTFEIEVKNLTSTNARGEELEKEIIVKVTNKLTKQVEIWPRDKFTDRKLLIEDMYQHFLENGRLQNKMEQDPFWDPVEILHIGSAHVWLASLAYCIAYEDQVDVINNQGKEEAVIQIRLFPCRSTGTPLGEESVNVDPGDLLGKRMDFQMQIHLCLGVKWIRGHSSRGVQIGYMMYGLPVMFYTPAAWNHANLRLDYTMCFTIQHVTTDFLSYLKTHAVVLELWGLQEGCQEMETDFANVPLASDGYVLLDLCYRNQWTSVPLDSEEHKFNLSEQLKTLEEESENLRDSNRTLQNENLKLRKKLAKLRSFPSNQGLIANGDPTKSTGDRSNQKSPFPSWDAEFAKALKIFYFSMIGVRGRLIQLKEVRPLDEERIHCLRYFANERRELVKELGEELESCLGKLKNEVAKIIRRKKELQIDATAST
ncbi:kinesin-like protein KIF28P [Scyliorhinus canicula]|uniref:kinesin-like protein KIF28P n=1 Tax=Scyliorhinus canicula TaxID=7830 RepID=UPI0018F7C038|nr:kinesin-like protein KIF28P [Scyliorhinus canicula]